MVGVKKLLAATAVLAAARDHEQIPLSSKPFLSSDYSCIHPPYKVHLVSRSPLVMYLEGFLTGGERSHLQNLA